MRVHVIEDLCPPPRSTFFAANGRRRSNKPSKQGRDIDGISNRGEATAAKPPREKQFYICRVLQMGPAVGARAVIGMTTRRPKSGILKLLALNDRKGKGATAIEPEVALLMANLAKASGLVRFQTYDKILKRAFQRHSNVERMLACCNARHTTRQVS